MENRKKTASYKALCWVFLSLVILQVGSVSAFEFDNVKSYEDETQTITVTNALGLGDTIATITLNTPIDNKVPRGYGKVAEFTITNYADYNNALKELELFDIKKDMKKLSRDFDYKYLTYEDIEINDYENVCNGFLTNGTAICSYEITGTHLETKEKWIKLTPADLKKNDELIVGIFTDVQKRDSVEWIPNMFGVRVEEWASWTESMNVGLNHYYTFDSHSTDVRGADIGNQYNLTAFGDPTWATGIIGNSTDLDGSGDYFNSSVGTYGFPSGTGDFAVSYWINPTSLAWWDGMISMDSASDAFDIYISGISSKEIRPYVAGTSIETSDDLMYAGGWQHIVITRESGNVDVYHNGTKEIDAFSASGSITTGNLLVGISSQGTGDIPAKIDELGIWNRSITTGEITDLYNEGTGITYTDIFNQNPTVTLNTPINYTNTTSQSVTFNWSVGDDAQVDNSTLYIDGVLNQTFAHGTSNQTYEQVIFNFADGDYNWTVTAKDDESAEGTTDTRFFTIDTTNPSVIINTPTAGQKFLTNSIPLNISVNVTVSDANIESCLFYNGTANNTVTCGNNVTILLGAGDHTIGWYANDTLNNENYTERTFNINYYYHNASYTDPAVEQETYDFNLTVTAINLGTFNGTFYYNNTAYVADYSDNGTVGKLGYSIQTNDLGTIPFNFTYYVDGTLFNVNYTHVVNQVQNLSVVAGGACPAGLSPALHYDFKNEQNDTILNNTIDYIFRYGVTNPNLRTTAGSLTATEFTVCINSTIWNNYSLGYGEIQYQPTDYSDRRYYLFSSDRLSNQTVNNTLYSLIAGSSTSFLFQIQEADLSVFDDVYLTLNRWYPEEDDYKIVEMSKTDDEGETVMKVEIEDVDYRVGVYYLNGTLIYLASPFRLVCIATPCTYALIVPEDVGASFTNWKNLQVSLTYNYTTDIFTMVYNDPSQDTSQVNLSVYRDTGISELLVCTDSASSYTGVLNCNVSGYTGTLRAIGYRTASPETPIIIKTIQQGIDKLGKTPALFITMLIIILFVSIGIVSPIATVIFAVLAFIPAMMFGFMPLPFLIIIGAMGFIVLHFMKRSVGN